MKTDTYNLSRVAVFCLSLLCFASAANAQDLNKIQYVPDSLQNAISDHSSISIDEIKRWSRPAIAMQGEPVFGENRKAFPYVRPDAPKGGTLRLAVTGSYDSTNPFILLGRPVEGTGLVFESLMCRSWDEPFTLYGLLAESIATPPDRAWVAFTLNPAARFSDGTPVTAEDVLFSFNRLKTSGRANHRSFYGQVDSVKKMDPRTVLFIFKKGGNRELPLILGLMPILSKADWEQKDFAKTTLRPLLGSGPYRFENIEPGRSVTYRRNQDYWARDLWVRRGQYNPDTIRYDYYRDDSLSLEAFKAGQYDLRREPDAARWLNAYDFPAAQEGRVKLETLPHRRTEPFFALTFNLRRKAFADVRVREALIYAFDFEWINRALLANAYRRAISVFPNSELAAPALPTAAERALLEPYRAQLPAALFTAPVALPQTDGSGPAGLRANLRAADALLSAAGYRLDNGKRIDPHTQKPFTFEILLGEPAQERLALEYARALTRLGIEATVRTADSAQYQKRLSDFDYDMTAVRWFSTLSPGNEQRVYWGSAAATQRGSRNYAGLQSPAVDGLIDRLSNAATRAELVTAAHALDRVLFWQRAFIPLYYSAADRIARRANIEHPAQTPLYGFIQETVWVNGP